MSTTSINCLGNLCQRTGNKMHNYMEEIQNVLLDNLEIILEDVRRLNERQWLESPKLASCTLRAMQLVLAEEKPNQLQSDRLMRVLPNFALLHYEDRVNVYPFRLVADTRAVVTSSESEFSESESSISGKRDRVRIRQHALQCIQQLAKISTAVVFTHLDRLFQGGQQTGRRTLLMAILEEETTELRITACSVLMTIISYGKSYFATASERVSQISSFISLSEKMGVLLRQFHTTLIAALQRESDASFTVSILQCASVLANSVPYERCLPFIYYVYLTRYSNALIDIVVQ
ncbi:hypothetical protein BDF22DRAFT_445245 [Syncephalis plumigaleata]|nr:hypothetical protein BDF22DRAFT_445245 [Syncephalis plumigaleata]